jgi:hypothetical protein
MFMITQIHRTPKSEEISSQFDEELHGILRRSLPQSFLFNPEEYRSGLDQIAMSQIAINLYPNIVDLSSVVIEAPSVRHLTEDSHLLPGMSASGYETG